MMKFPSSFSSLQKGKAFLSSLRRQGSCESHTGAPFLVMPYAKHKNINKNAVPCANMIPAFAGMTHSDKPVCQALTSQRGAMFGQELNLRKPMTSQTGAVFGQELNLRKPMTSQTGAVFGQELNLRKPMTSQRGAMFGQELNLRKPMTSQRGAVFGQELDLRKPITSQKGAMFGLDARIALAIFGALSVIAGAYTAMNINSIYANSFAKELSSVAQAIEAIHNDLKQDVHSNLIENSDTNAYIALYDNYKLEDHLRGKWLGPYITSAVPVHPRYGEIRIKKRAKNMQEDCSPEDICYLWLTYDTVAYDVAQELNEIFDGTKDQDPPVQGRIQWQSGADAKHMVLGFRTSRSLGGADYY